MDELRVVPKKKGKEVKVLTTLVKTAPGPDNIFNPKVFNCSLFASLRGHTGDILALAAGPGLIISGSQDKTIKTWDTTSGKLLSTLEGHQSGVYSLAVSGNYLLSASADRTVKVWDLAAAKLLFTLLGHNNHVYSISAENGLFATASLDRTIKIWQLETKKILRVIPTGDSSALAICISGGRLVAGLSDGSIKVWNIQNGALAASYQENEHSITSVYCTDGLLITGSKDKTIRLWDLATLDLLKTLTGHKGTVWSVTLDSGKIISGSDDKTVKIWSLETGDLIDTLTGHKDWVSSVVSAAGLIFSGSGDGLLNIWTKVPLHNCNTIDFSRPHAERSPFETDQEYERKLANNLERFQARLTGYEYIKIGKAELLAAEYSPEQQNLPVKLSIHCDKIIKFSGLSTISFSSLTIGSREAELLYKKAAVHDLFIRYFPGPQGFKFELSLVYASLKYNFDLKLQADDQTVRKKQGSLKTDRLKITRGSRDYSHALLTAKPVHDCNTIDISDTFRSPFESLPDFELRVRKKLTGYGHINIGKADLIAEKYDIDRQTFPLKVLITCDKILNISDLEKEFTALITIERYMAREMYEKSGSRNLFIYFYENDGRLFYNLVIIYKDTEYFIS